MRNWQKDNIGIRLHQMEHKTKVAKEAWALKMDAQRSMDKALDVIVRMPGAQKGFLPKRVLWTFGLDYDPRARTKGLLTPKDEKAARQLWNKLKASSSSDNAVIVRRCKEHYTSTYCPYCFYKNGQVMETVYKKDAEGKNILRVKICENCRRIFHRDLMAAENMALMGYAAATYKKLPKCFSKSGRVFKKNKKRRYKR